jgi:hypothetical protein|tara:strand:+ start:72 stop:347 length:276 start_codon:yes stop_codon:yes gene_type:complete
MEVIKSRYGLERTIEKIDANRIRVMGESQFVRQSQNDAGKVTMFDYEGGPCLSVGGEISYQNLKWLIKGITPKQSQHEGLSECVLTVEAKY